MSDRPSEGSTPVPPRKGKKAQPAGGIVRASRPVSKSGSGRPPSGRQPSGRQARQAAQRRNRLLAGGSVLVVVVVVVVLVLVAVTGGSSGGSLRHPASADAVSKMTHVPTSVLVAAANEVGTSNLYPAVTATGLSATKLTSGGKPQLLFMGAEFCPICATQRWPLIVALSQFGTFTNLQQTHSALTDGNIPTWSFYGATYTSPYFTFTPYEVETNTDKPLQTPPANLVSMWSNFFGGQEEFPYFNFGGKIVLASSQFPDTTLEGKSFDDILQAVGSNDNTVGADIDASAAVLTKYICDNLSGGQPASVCQAVSKVSAPVSASSPGGQTSTATGNG